MDHSSEGHVQESPCARARMCACAHAGVCASRRQLIDLIWSILSIWSQAHAGHRNHSTPVRTERRTKTDPGTGSEGRSGPADPFPWQNAAKSPCRPPRTLLCRSAVTTWSLHVQSALGVRAVLPSRAALPSRAGLQRSYPPRHCPCLGRLARYNRCNPREGLALRPPGRALGACVWLR